MTVFIGPLGSGESTIARLATHFWDIDGGRILLGGNDIAHIDPEILLRNYAVVFQDVLLFNASVADNIRIGKRDAIDEEVRCVTRLIQCDNFTSHMPNGHNTIIGGNDETLSDGERQRISIARAFLKDAPVILLGETTASLDAENETKIQVDVSELVQDKTVIIVAHHTHAVRNADHIAILGGGTVIEQGVLENLMAKGEEFVRMVKLQQENNNEK